MKLNGIYTVKRHINNDFSLPANRCPRWDEKFDYYLFGIKIYTYINTGTEKHIGTKTMGFNTDKNG